jgi:hypothetical protein
MNSYCNNSVVRHFRPENCWHLETSNNNVQLERLKAEEQNKSLKQN